jgi:hypothetical protein
MSLDTIEVVVEDIFDQCDLEDQVLGFSVDKHHNNLGTIPDRYVYEEENIAVRDISGTMLYVAVGRSLARSRLPKRSKNLFYPLESNGKRGEVGLRLVYNGKILIVTEIVFHGSETTSYVNMVLRLHHFVLGTRMGLYEHCKEAIDFIGTVPVMSYVPVTCSYPELLTRVLKAKLSDACVTVNPKHDGSSCWIYMSPTVNASLVLHTKHRLGYSYKYYGRLECLKHVSTPEPCAIMAEMITEEDQMYLIATDVFLSRAMEYKDRCNHLLQIIGNYNVKDVYLSSYRFRITANRTVGQICNIMDKLQLNTDGYVVYIGDERPFKVKLCSMMTLDLEYSYKVVGDAMIHTWNTNALGPIDNPLTLYPYLDAKRTYVFEVNVSSGKVVRLRTDRTRGNSSVVVDLVLKAYSKDSKYSLQSVWCGKDLRFLILVNRMFKHYVYMTYIPELCRLIDMGSGNGGDSNIWLDRKYNVLAIEKDPTRCIILRDKVRANPHIAVRRRDMLDIKNVLKNTPAKYSHVTFMRSIGHLSPEQIVTMLCLFKSYKIQRIVIVTSIMTSTVNYRMDDGFGNMFTMNIDEEGNTEVSYHIPPKAPVEYHDRSYTLREWQHMATFAEYRLRVESQWDVLSSVYGLSYSEILFPCTLDKVLIMDI